MKRLICALLLCFVFSGCNDFDSSLSQSHRVKNTVEQTPVVSSNYVSIKYRDDKVDITNSRFEELNTSKSSFIKGAWYDRSNQYMVIKLNDTYYHYCDMPEKVWHDFKRADSFGKKFNAAIKGNYDCRKATIPTY